MITNYIESNILNTKIKIRYILIVIILILSSIFMILKQYEIETINTNGINIQMSNKIIRWGTKRNKNNIQPELGDSNVELIEKYNGICIGNENSNQIYLTFDQGYEAGYTNQILDVLKEKNVTAAFFLTAHYINNEDEIVARIINEGHIIGNHTVNHKSLPTLSQQELEDEIIKLHNVVKEKYDYEMKYIRPPMGEISEQVLYELKEFGYSAVMWSFAYEDWDEKKQPSTGNAFDKISSNFHNGEIILLHGNSKTNTEILGQVIDEARKQGYEFKSLDEFEI